MGEFKNFETLESHISRQQKIHPYVRGTFSNILRRVGVASKIIAAKVQKAGLIDILGTNHSINVQGEEQVKLDSIANKIVTSAFSVMPAIVGMASEEEASFTQFPRHLEHEGSRYLVVFDPLDGSSNVDANVSVGTIFAIIKYRKDPQDQLMSEDFFRPGAELSAAGYIIYGPSNMFVYSTGHGVHGFTLDPEIGEYILSHENIKIPNQCRCFSANESHVPQWDLPTRQFADYLRSGAHPRYAGISSRYIGSLVADFHRNLLYGGIYLYPQNVHTGKAKLRLLYECAPLAFLAEQAGGKATTGRENILDIVPTDLHQRVPLVIGNRQEVELYEQMVANYKISAR